MENHKRSYIPHEKREVLRFFQWIAAACLGIFFLLGYLWPPVAAPLQSISLSLGFVMLLLACLLLLLTVSPTDWETPALIGIYLVFLCWMGFKAWTSPTPAEGAEWFEMFLQGGWLFAIGLILPRPLISSMPEILSRKEKRDIELGRRESFSSRLPEANSVNLFTAFIGFFAILGVIAALHGIYQVFFRFEEMYREMQALYEMSGHSLQREGILYAAWEKRALGNFGNANVYCAFLAFLLPALFALLLRLNEKSWRWIISGGIGLILYAGMLSGSRGGLLGLLLALIIGLIILKKDGVKRYWKPLATGIAMAAVLLLIARPQQEGEFSLNQLGAGSPVESISEKSTEAEDAGSGFFSRLTNLTTVRERVYYWRSAWEMIKQNPLTGNGLGTYLLLYQKHKIPDAHESRDAHNVFLQLGAESGLIGAGLFSMWLLGCAVVGFRSAGGFAQRPFLRAAHWTLAGMIAVFVLDSLYNFSYMPIFRHFYFLFCLGAGLFVSLTLSVRPTTEYDFHRKWYRRPLPLLYLGLIAGSLILFWPIVATPALARFNRLTGEDVFNYGQNLDLAFSYFRRATQLQPNDPENYLKMSHVRRRQGRLNDAMIHINQAIEKNPQLAPLHAAKADLALAMEDYETAEASYRRALELYPLKAKYYGELARVYASRQEWEEAEQALEQALEAATIELRSGFLAQLADVYLQQNRMQDAIDALERAVERALPRDVNQYRRQMNEVRSNQ